MKIFYFYNKLFNIYHSINIYIPHELDVKYIVGAIRNKKF